MGYRECLSHHRRRVGFPIWFCSVLLLSDVFPLADHLVSLSHLLSVYLAFLLSFFLCSHFCSLFPFDGSFSVTETQPDENGVEQTVTVMKPGAYQRTAITRAVRQDRLVVVSLTFIVSFCLSSPHRAVFQTGCVCSSRLGQMAPTASARGCQILV